MRDIKIPIIDQSFILYIGEDDYYKYIEKARKETPEYEYSDICEGLTGGESTGRLIWLGNGKDNNLIYHEFSHYFHHLFNLIACAGENEFKAYITAWVFCEVFKYIKEDIK